MTEPGAGKIVVEVVYALADRYWSKSLRLPTGASVAEALANAGKAWLPEACRAEAGDPAGIAIFGRPAMAKTVLHDGDRIELLRPLQADPKMARRKRAADAKRARR